MLTGKRAFDGSTPSSMIAAILERPAPSVSDVAPAALDRVVKRSLEKDSENRWQSARDLTAAWDLVEPSSQLGTALPPAPEPRLRGWLSPAVAVGLGLGLAAVSAIHFREGLPVAETIRFQAGRLPR